MCGFAEIYLLHQILVHTSMKTYIPRYSTCSKKLKLKYLYTCMCDKFVINIRIHKSLQTIYRITMHIKLHTRTVTQINNLNFYR